MAVRSVLRYPDPALRVPADRVEDPAGVAALARDLVETMRAHPRCVGIAAPQVGAPVRVCVVDCTAHPKAPDAHGLLVLVNPVLRCSGDPEIGREGCLSVPELTANVARRPEVALEAVTPAGAPVRLTVRGFEARAVQHEADHLDGVLFLDRVVNPAADVFRRRRRGVSGG